jgi:hypothetical protein
MASNEKVPSTPCIPKGLIALARVPRTSEAPGNPPPAASPAAAEEQTRIFQPNRALLEPSQQLEPMASFADAADEQTIIGVANLGDPRVFRSEPPPAPALENIASEATTIEFVGALSGFGDEESRAPVTEPTWASDEETTLYRPRRSRLPPEEPTEEFELETNADEQLSGPVPRKVIVAADVLAGLPLDSARAEHTKKRRGRGGVGGKVGFALCLCGGVALALSAAWRYPSALPTAHGALTRVAGVVTGR